MKIKKKGSDKMKILQVSEKYLYELDIYSKKELKYIMRDIIPLWDGVHKKEKFKQVIVNGVYAKEIISSYGRIFSVKERKGITTIYEKKPSKSPDGYLMTTITINGEKKGFGIHRLVAMTFIKSKRDVTVLQANHKDGDKTNNCYWNLEWVTQLQNIRHAWKTGLHPVYYGDKSSHHKFTSKDIEEVCKLIEKNKSFREIEAMTNVSYHMIKKIFKKNNWVEISDKYDFSNYKYGKRKKDCA